MTTPNTGIPYVPEDTQDPAAGLNLALNVIDALLQTAVIDMDQTAPPGSPADGDLHIVASPATGAWLGEENSLARYVADGDFWQFYAAGTQVHLILNKDGGGLYAWDGVAWTLAAGLGDAPSDGTGYVRKDATWVAESGGGGGAAWGAIAGTLSDQTDLQAALDLKQARSPSIQSVASSATVTPTFADDMVKITAQAAGLTLANPTGTAIPGLGIVIRIKDNGTARAISYDTQYRAMGVTLPTTTVIGKTLYLAMVFNDTDTKWDVLAVGQEA